MISAITEEIDSSLQGNLNDIGLEMDVSKEDEGNEI